MNSSTGYSSQDIQVSLNHEHFSNCIRNKPKDGCQGTGPQKGFRCQCTRGYVSRHDFLNSSVEVYGTQNKQHMFKMYNLIRFDKWLCHKTITIIKMRKISIIPRFFLLFYKSLFLTFPTSPTTSIHTKPLNCFVPMQNCVFSRNVYKLNHTIHTNFFFFFN